MTDTMTVTRGQQDGKRDVVLQVLSAAARFIMAFVWISAGWAKIGQHMTVTQTIMAYQIFTPEWSDMLARIIGPLEIAGGLFLLLGIRIREAGWVSIVVLSLFIIGLSSAYARGLDIDCGCFGAAGDSSSSDIVFTIVRDIVFVGITLFMIRFPFKKYSLWI